MAAKQRKTIRTAILIPANTPKGYRRVSEQMERIYCEFMDGASVRRLGRKHSLGVGVIEFVLRMKMRARANY